MIFFNIGTSLISIIDTSPLDHGGLWDLMLTSCKVVKKSFTGCLHDGGLLQKLQRATCV